MKDLYGGQFRHHRAALHGKDDQQLYSREAIPALINYLRSELKEEFHFSTLVRDVEPGHVHTTAQKASNSCSSPSVRANRYEPLRLSCRPATCAQCPQISRLFRARSSRAGGLAEIRPAHTGLLRLVAGD